MGSKTSRQIQAAETKDKISKTLIRQMRERSINEITIRELCQLADISTGAFYHHFSCKEEAILYTYRNSDKIFESLDLKGSPRENIVMIVKTHLGLLQPDTIVFTQQLYTAHLAYNDDYFSSEKRCIFQMLRGELASFLGSHASLETVSKLTWKILNYCRGCIYNQCIRPDQVEKNWFEEPVSDMLWILDRIKNELS